MQANWLGLSVTLRTNSLLSVAIAKRSSPAKFNSSQQNKIDRINHDIFLSIKFASSFQVSP